MLETLTSEQIDALSGRELELAVARALHPDKSIMWMYGSPIYWKANGMPVSCGRFNTTDAAIALCVETGWQPEWGWYKDIYRATLTELEAPDFRWYSGDGSTLAEACLRAWLRRGQ